LRVYLFISESMSNKKINRYKWRLLLENSKYLVISSYVISLLTVNRKIFVTEEIQCSVCLGKKLWLRATTDYWLLESQKLMIRCKQGVLLTWYSIYKLIQSKVNTRMGSEDTVCKVSSLKGSDTKEPFEKYFPAGNTDLLL